MREYLDIGGLRLPNFPFFTFSQILLGDPGHGLWFLMFSFREKMLGVLTALVTVSI